MREQEKIILITGSTDGIGLSTAIKLASLKNKVIVHGRNLEKASRVASIIKRQTGNNKVYSCFADLTSKKDILALADNLHKNFSRIDVLINNAGVYEANRVIIEQCCEKTFFVNHLSHFILTNAILDLIKKSPSGRIINVSSMVHAHSIDFNNLQGEKYFDGYTAYSYSKLCNILFTKKLSKLLKNTNITVNCLHPGVINTKLLKKGWGAFGATTETGAKTSVFLALSSSINVTGQYFAGREAISPASISEDPFYIEKCWQLSCKYSSLL